MATLYLESSALLAWLLGDSRAAEAQEAIDAASTVVTSVITFVEVERALIQIERRRVLTEGDTQRLRGLVRRLGESWMSMAITEEVLERAARAFPVEPVRTVGALHLASALAFTQAFPDLQFLSFDDRVRDNARALGIA